MNLEVLSVRDSGICQICGTGSLRSREGRNVTIHRCGRCGTSRIDHRPESKSSDDGGDYWKSNGNPEFNKVLYTRRALQGRLFLKRFAVALDLRSMPDSSVVDYGCGMGAFVSEAEQYSLAVAGCDLSLPDQTILSRQPWRSLRFTTLATPWEIDRTTELARVVLLLDVLEHHANPKSFVEKLANSEIVVIKVPNSWGPLGLLSRVCFPLSEGLYDRLALVGDVAPHLWSFTDRGLSDMMLRTGFRSVGRMRIAEVGVEASSRSRSGAKGRLGGWALGFAGGVLALISPLWSESIFRVYRRTIGTEQEASPIR